MSKGHGGIEWREWSDAAFAEAKQEDKPVLLDIGAVWCHWCHVMDEGIAGDPIHTGTYSDPLVQERIAHNFIPIKVDNDRRPDINARYNMGGWPTTAFLTGDGNVIYGETYVTPGRMVTLLDHVAHIYRHQKDELKEQLDVLREAKSIVAADRAAETLDPDTAEVVAQAILRNFDPVFGGFGSQPKFPHPDSLLFALERYSATGDSRLRQFAETTMQAMDSGGMYDRYAGGFFRYSTTRDWSIPHYEKMLEDNARLTVAYAQAAVVLAEDEASDHAAPFADRYLQTVRSSHGWLLETMQNPETGTFAGSQDADAEEFYYGKPLDVRCDLPTPYIDRTVYADWNALLVSSFAKRYQLTGEAEMLEAAMRTYGFLRTHLAREFGGSSLEVLHFSTANAGIIPSGLLADQTAMAAAAIDLFETTGDPAYRSDAKGLLDFVKTALFDEASGAFFDVVRDPDAIGEMARPKAEMKENAEVAREMLRIAAHCELPDYRQSAEGALCAFTNEYRNTGYFASVYARAVESALAQDLHIVIVGDFGESASWKLLRVAWILVRPGKTVEPIDSRTVNPEVLEKRGYPIDPAGKARAYVCVGTQCLPPAETPNALRERLFGVMEKR